MKIRPVVAELFHVDGQTDRHDEANIRFRNFANEPKNKIIINKLTVYLLTDFFFK